MDVASLRSEFPVLSRAIYLNAGTDGPIPRRAVDAAQASMRVELEDGRAGEAHFERMMRLRDGVRERIAALMGCDAAEIAITRSATDGVNGVLIALALGPGDEVITTDEEHPGVHAPLGAHSRRSGFTVRTVKWDELAGAVGPRTKLIACSHVSWINGRVIDVAALRATGVPVLLDGAQGLGAVPIDVRELGVDFYATAGQKWLCGPDGTGYLYVRRERADQLEAPWASYITSSEPPESLTSPPVPGTARFDMGVVPAATSAWVNAALDVLGEQGWDEVHARAIGLAAELAEQLRANGLEVAPRGDSTLVSWHSGDAGADVKRLAGDGIIVRDLPGRGLVRASVGAWVTEEELHRVATVAAATA